MSKPQRPRLTKLALDVMKPHEPSILELAKALSQLEEVSRVGIELGEVDMETETVRVVLEGEDLDYEKIKRTIKDFGAVVHSIDEVVYTRGR